MIDVNTVEIGISFSDGSLFYVPRREKVTIPKEKPFITLKGSGAKNTVISWNADAQSSGGTYNSGTVTVLASDFKARDITFEVISYVNCLLKS